METMLRRLGDTWSVVGRSDSGVIATIVHTEYPWVAVQFHPGGRSYRIW